MNDLKGLVTMYPEQGFQANAYIIRTADGMTVIDPSFPPEKLSGGDRDRLNLLVATHGHFDHTAGAAAWMESKKNVPFYMHKDDQGMWDDPNQNVSSLFGRGTNTARADHELREGVPIDIGSSFILTPIHTPGHTAGSVCLLMESRLSNGLTRAVCLFTGDTIFINSIGRCDFPGGSEQAMQSSLKKLLDVGRRYPFSPDLPLFFGHGRSGSWSEALQMNPWLRSLREHS